MVFYLTDQEKILILAVAASLFLISVIVTVCVVSPVCAIHRWMFKAGKKAAAKAAAGGKGTEQLLKPESKHFQLTVIPHYGTQVTTLVAGQPSSKGTLSLNSQHENATINGNVCKAVSDTSPAAKKSERKLSKKHSMSETPPTISNAMEEPGLINLGFAVESVNEQSVKIIVRILGARDLKIRPYGTEPNAYVILELLLHSSTSRSRRKSSQSNKVAATFRTGTAKRGLNPQFDECFTTAVLPRAILKDGLLRFKLMDDERYANDTCLGEVRLPIKELAAAYGSIEQTAAIVEQQPIEYPLMASKEFKGDLLFGFCYLPTSRRVTLTVFKANLASNPLIPNRNYYVRILMFINGKLMKKKKTPTSEKMMWSDCETLTFELTNGSGHESNDHVTFMLVLSWSSDVATAPSTSPSSPESPDTPDSGTNGSRKDRHIGHFIVGGDCWREMTTEPRKQFSKWAKLM